MVGQEMILDIPSLLQFLSLHSTTLVFDNYRILFL